MTFLLSKITLFPMLLVMLACNNGNEPVADQNPPPKSDSNVILNVNELSNPFAAADKSPMDMSYYPVDYPVLKMANKINEPPVARVIYSRPVKAGRKIFGGLLKYGQPWRLGANEASEIEFFRQVTIHNKKIPAGRYIIYCIPQETNWTVILNTHLYSWGLTPDPSKDTEQFNIPVEKYNGSIEYFTMVFKKTNQGADLVMVWDDVLAKLPVRF